jgi:hypothetical protein
MGCQREPIAVPPSVASIYSPDSSFSAWFEGRECGGLILTFHAICSTDQKLLQSGLEYLATEFLIVSLAELVDGCHRLGRLPKPVLA